MQRFDEQLRNGTERAFFKTTIANVRRIVGRSTRNAASEWLFAISCNIDLGRTPMNLPVPTRCCCRACEKVLTIVVARAKPLP